MQVFRAPAEAVGAVGEGLTVPGSRLKNPVVVEVSPSGRVDRGWPHSMLAAAIVGGEFAGGEIGVWAIGEPPDFAPILPVNRVALEWSTWGEAARPGSEALEVNKRLAGYAEAREARAECKRTLR